MPDSYTVEFTNAAAFDAAMAEIRRELAEPKKPLQEAARATLAAAQAAAPRLTGRLAGAHRAEAPAGQKCRVVVDTPYAAPIHWGWPGHGIRRQPWLVATWMRDPAGLNAMAAQTQMIIDKAVART